MNNQQMTLIQQMRLLEDYAIKHHKGIREDYLEAKRKLFMNQITYREALHLIICNICERWPRYWN